MNKKILIGFTVVLLLALGATTVFGALNDSQKSELDQLYQQMVTIQNQIIDKRIEYNQLTPDQGKWMKKRMEERLQYMKNNNYDFPCGNGGGMMGGYGYGSGMMGNW